MHDRTLELVAELRRLKPDSEVLRFFDSVKARGGAPCSGALGARPAAGARGAAIPPGAASLERAARRLGRAIVARALR